MGEEDNAFAALEEGSQIAGTITEHVEMVQKTARGARGKVEAAEAEIDRGWAFIRRTTGSEASVRGSEEMLERAATLVAEARAELSVAKPDWLALVARAERGRELAAQVRSGSAGAEPAANVRAAGEREIPDRAGSAPVPFARADLERARERAKLARDRALAVSWTADDRQLSQGSLQLIDQTERAYQRGVTLEKSLGEQPRGHQPEMLESVLEAYRMVQELGDIAYDQAQADLRRRQR